MGLLPPGSIVDAGLSFRSFQVSLSWICAAFIIFHTLCNMKKVLIVCQKGINEFQKLCGGFTVVEIIMLCYLVPC
jgi:hypothetical protein